MLNKFYKLMFILFITSCTTEKIELPQPPPPPPPTPQWTIMVYMTADNDLEPFSLSDLTEMSAVGSSSDVNIVVQIDRSPEYSSDAVVNLPDFTTTKRILVQKDNLQELSDLGELNMGDTNTLKDFISWTLQNYPAQKYALVIWDHGLSWQGAGQDETNNDGLTLSEISTALKDINQWFNLIGFDECLMGSIEVAYEMSFYGNVLVASEETEPGVGWNYDAILTELSQSPEMNEYELAQLIVNAYKQGVAEEVPEQLFETTLAAIDLTRIDMVLDSLNNFFYYLGNNATSISDLIPVEIAVDQSEVYGKSNPFEGGQFFDLYNIAQYLSLLSPEPELSFLADNVKASIDSIIYYRWSAPERPHSHGLSIWWPMEESDYDSSINDYRNIKFVAETNWEDFLTGYKGLKASDTILPTVANVIPSSGTVTPGTPITVTANVSDNYLVKTVYLISFINVGGTLYAMSISPEEDIYADCTQSGKCPANVSFDFDALGTTVGDGTNEEFFPTIEINEDVKAVMGIYQEGAEQQEAIVFFDVNAGNMISMYFIGDEFSEYTPQPGSLFYPYDYIYDTVNDDIVQEPSSTGFIATSLRIRAGVAYPSGNYILAVVASDFSDTENYAGVTITVQ